MARTLTTGPRKPGGIRSGEAKFGWLFISPAVIIIGVLGGIYVIGFSFPVVPQGQARIRIQVSAAHTPEQLDLAAFVRLADQLAIQPAPAAD